MPIYVFFIYFNAFWGNPGVGDPEGNLVFSQVRCLSTFSSLLELEADATDATDAADAADATEVVSSTAARTPPSTRAGGQDDVS